VGLDPEACPPSAVSVRVGSAWPVPVGDPGWVDRVGRWSDDAPVDVFLETERLFLRRFTEDDVDNLVELDSDPQVMHYITGGRTTPREEIRDDYLPAFLGYYQRYRGYGFWAAVEKPGAEFLGWFHFRPPPEDGLPDEPELGYRLRRSAWGKGYGTEGSRALIDKGFAEFGTRRVFAHAMAVNTASRRVMEKAGLIYVRTFHEPWPYVIEGDEHGSVEYALSRDQWQRLPRLGAGVSP
jgi:RimJ/RimL family protein N-acetyltransferase